VEGINWKKTEPEMDKWEAKFEGKQHRKKMINGKENTATKG
jgi:hypothetical protein